MSHTNTRALITGGSQGLGLAIARRLIEEGCKRLAITGRDAAKGEAAAAALSQNGVKAHFIRADMTDPAQVFEMVERAAALLGGLNALVNSAGDTSRGSILDTTPATWDAIMAANARGPFFAIQRFAQQAIEAGHGGGVVNIQSIVVHCGMPFLAPYVASKAALSAITRNSADALARHRIRVNGVNVGWMDTPGEDVVQREIHGRESGWLAAVEADQPFGMLVKPEHVAAQVSLFLSPESGVVTGSVIDFDQRVVGAYPDTNDSGA